MFIFSKVLYADNWCTDIAVGTSNLIPSSYKETLEFTNPLNWEPVLGVAVKYLKFSHCNCK